MLLAPGREQVFESFSHDGFTGAASDAPDDVELLEVVVDQKLAHEGAGGRLSASKSCFFKPNAALDRTFIAWAAIKMIVSGGWALASVWAPCTAHTTSRPADAATASRWRASRAVSAL